ncbi:MAG: fatty acid--CoA ligase family protein [bacterium]|nr:fatty acid--CoA ligase family protein [bacterium]
MKSTWENHQKSCFYFDPSSGVAVDYRQLTDEIAALGTIADGLAGPDACESLIALLAAITHNQHISLLPPGMCRDEAQSEVEKSRNIQPPASDGNTGQGRVPARDAAATSFTSADAATSEAPSDNSQILIHAPKTGRAPINLAEARESQCKVGIFTSGTTGRPKLVWHSTRSLTRGVRVGPKHEHDVWGLTYHPAHFAGLQVALQALLNGNPLIRLHGLNPDQVSDAIQDCEITHISATPTWFKLQTASDHHYPGVRAITLGGERMPESLAASLRDTFPQARIRNIYASTELGSLLVGRGHEFEIPDDLQDRIRIIDGELSAHRSLLADSLQEGSLDDVADVFFRTGDLVEISCEKPLRFIITSRRSDWINVGGYKVNPLKVESLIAAEPAVAETRVYGQPNSVTGSIVCCDIVPRDAEGFDLRALKQQLRQQLERYEVPQIFQIVTELPITSSGKKKRERESR